MGSRAGLDLHSAQALPLLTPPLWPPPWRTTAGAAEENLQERNPQACGRSGGGGKPRRGAAGRRGGGGNRRGGRGDEPCLGGIDLVGPPQRVRLAPQVRAGRFVRHVALLSPGRRKGRLESPLGVRTRPKGHILVIYTKHSCAPPVYVLFSRCFTVCLRFVHSSLFSAPPLIYSIFLAFAAQQTCCSSFYGSHAVLRTRVCVRALRAA